MRNTIKKKITKGFLLFLFTFFSLGVQAQWDEYGGNNNFREGDIKGVTLEEVVIVRPPRPTGGISYGAYNALMGNEGAGEVFDYYYPSDYVGDETNYVVPTPCPTSCKDGYKVIACECEKIPEKLLDPCAKAKLADHSYKTKNGVIQAGAPPLPKGTTSISQQSMLQDPLLKDVDLTNSNGFNSALYRVDHGNGKIEYVYSTQGTDPLSFKDWLNNGQQATGNQSEQYALSVANARKLKIWADANHYTLSFTGHSLGGGMANANALATGLKATIFNPAGLQNHTIADLNLNINYSNKVTAYVVRGEPVDIANFAFGDPVRGTTKYIGSAVVPFAGYGCSFILGIGTGIGGTTLGLIVATNLHLMGAVKTNLGCN